MAGLRVAVVGATGALGAEVLVALDEVGLPIRELLPIASERSFGAEVDFQGALYAVEMPDVDLGEVDLVFVCAPPGAALDWVVRALRTQARVFDLSGALAARSAASGSPEIEALLADLAGPLVAMPPGVALACLRVLAPLAEGFGLRRVVATALVSASASGRGAVEALHEESAALLGGLDSPEAAGDHPVGFDVLPWAGEVGAGGASELECVLAGSLARALGPELGIAATVVRVPVFCGEGASLAIETQRVVDPKRAREALREAVDVEVIDDPRGPSIRAAAGVARVLVGRLRGDPSRPDALQLWLAADGARLAAVDAVRTAAGRLG